MQTLWDHLATLRAEIADSVALLASWDREMAAGPPFDIEAERVQLFGLRRIETLLTRYLTTGEGAQEVADALDELLHSTQQQPHLWQPARPA